MMKIYLFMLIILFSSCSKEKQNNPIEYNRLIGQWKGLDLYINYSLTFENDKVLYGYDDSETKFLINSVIYNQFNVEKDFIISTRQKFSPFGKYFTSQYSTLEVNINQTNDTLIFKGIKYIKQ